IFAFEARRPLLFALACLFVTFAKEAGLIVLLGWVSVHALRDRRQLVYLLWGVPALAALYAVHKLFPGPMVYGYYKPGFMFGNVLAVFRPSAYGRTGFFHVVLAHLPLLAAFAGWGWLRWRGAGRGLMEVGLLLIPALWWMGMMMDLWTNTGRFIFLAFPAIILFQVRVMREYAVRLGLNAPS